MRDAIRQVMHRESWRVGIRIAAAATLLERLCLVFGLIVSGARPSLTTTVPAFPKDFATKTAHS